MDHQLLKVEEVAEYLRVSKMTVWRWCNEGKLPAFQIGREWRIRRAALDNMIREGNSGSSAQRFTQANPQAQG